MLLVRCDSVLLRGTSLFPQRRRSPQLGPFYFALSVPCWIIIRARFVWGYSPADPGWGIRLAHGDTAWNPFSDLLRFLLWTPPSGSCNRILLSDLRGGARLRQVSCHTAAGTGCWCHLCWAVRNLRADVMLNSRTACAPRSACVVLTLPSAGPPSFLLSLLMFVCLFVFVGTINNL